MSLCWQGSTYRLAIITVILFALLRQVLLCRSSLAIVKLSCDVGVQEPALALLRQGHKQVLLGNSMRQIMLLQGGY